MSIPSDWGLLNTPLGVLVNLRSLSRLGWLPKPASRLEKEGLLSPLFGSKMRAFFESCVLGSKMGLATPLSRLGGLLNLPSFGSKHGNLANARSRLEKEGSQVFVPLKP